MRLTDSDAPAKMRSTDDEGTIELDAETALLASRPAAPLRPLTTVTGTSGRSQREAPADKEADTISSQDRYGIQM